MQRNNDYIDFLKTFTLLLVVIGHNKYVIPVNDIPVVNYIFSGINPIIYSFHMPLFFMLSGGVYKICLNNGKYSTIRKLVNNKYHRLIIPFLITSVLIVFPVLYFIDGNNQRVIDIFIQTISVQNAQHLWFILDLFLIFIILYYPIKHFKPYILLSILLFLNTISDLSDIIVLQRLQIYMIWFYIGYLLLESILSMKLNFIGAMILFCIFFILYYFYNKIIFYNSIFRKLYFLLISITGCLSTISLSKLVINYFGKKIVGSCLYKNLKIYSFEIYLYSCPIQLAIISLFNNRILSYPINIYYSIVIYFSEIIVSILLSICMAKHMKLLKFHK